MKVLIVVDMQNDFITGALGTKEAREIICNVVHKIKEYDNIILTQDTHGRLYSFTLEGQKLPIKHCIKNTDGWKICPEIEFATIDKTVHSVEKQSFGSFELINYINALNNCIDEIDIVGVCTDICVISNALILRSRFPDTIIKVDSSCYAGSTPELHKYALEVMKSCQIEVR